MPEREVDLWTTKLFNEFLAAPLTSFLTAIGFPGDDAWAMQDFCGGLGGTGCSSAVRDKLLVDPFGP